MHSFQLEPLIEQPRLTSEGTVRRRADIPEHIDDLIQPRAKQKQRVLNEIKEAIDQSEQLLSKRRSSLSEEAISHWRRYLDESLRFTDEELAKY